MARARARPDAAHVARTTRRSARAIEVTRARWRAWTWSSPPRPPWPGRAARSSASTGSTTRRARGIERSAEFAAGDRLAGADHPPVRPASARRSSAHRRRSTRRAVERFLRFYADACLARGVTPLIENVPPVLRMRTGGVFLSPVGGHWRDLLEWRERVPELGFTLDTSHAALFRSFAAAYPSLFGLASDDEPRAGALRRGARPGTREVAHVSDAHGLLGEGLPYGRGELDLDPVVRRLGELVPVRRRRDQRAGPRRSAGHEGRLPRARARVRAPTPAPLRAGRAARAGRRLRLAGRAAPPRPGARRCSSCRSASAAGACCITGGGGSIGRALATFLLGFRPERVTVRRRPRGAR